MESLKTVSRSIFHLSRVMIFIAMLVLLPFFWQQVAGVFILLVIPLYVIFVVSRLLFLSLYNCCCGPCLRWLSSRNDVDENPTVGTAAAKQQREELTWNLFVKPIQYSLWISLAISIFLLSCYQYFVVVSDWEVISNELPELFEK